MALAAEEGEAPPTHDDGGAPLQMRGSGRPARSAKSLAPPNYCAPNYCAQDEESDFTERLPAARKKPTKSGGKKRVAAEEEEERPSVWEDAVALANPTPPPKRPKAARLAAPKGVLPNTPQRKAKPADVATPPTARDSDRMRGVLTVAVKNAAGRVIAAIQEGDHEVAASDDHGVIKAIGDAILEVLKQPGARKAGSRPARSPGALRCCSARATLSATTR